MNPTKKALIQSEKEKFNLIQNNQKLNLRIKLLELELKTLKQNAISNSEFLSSILT